MCIRDRSCGHNIHFISDDQLTQHTVSYTHLDVYKRQLMHTAHREFTYSRITSQAAKESIGNEINLELAVRVSAHQINKTGGCRRMQAAGNNGSRNCNRLSAYIRLHWQEYRNMGP